MASITKFELPKALFLRPELLLHPNIPKPLHSTNPRSILGDEWWDVERKKAYSKNNYHCFACGVHKYDAKYHQWLEAHEAYDIDYELGRAELKEIVALCHSCHNYIHDGKMQMDARSNRISNEKYHDIIEHGNLLVMHLPPVPEYIGNVAEWSEWHLTIDGKKYYGKFKTYQQWCDYYGVVI